MTIHISRADLERFDPGHRHGQEQRFCCPLPACAGKARTKAHRSLAVNMQTGAWHCHRCGASGLLREYQTKQPERRREEPPAATPPEDWRVRLQGLQPLPDSPAAAYLHSRGIPLLLAKDAGVKHHPDWCGCGPAAVFPLRDAAGVLVAAQGRYLDPQATPRMRTAGPVVQGIFCTPGALDGPRVIITEAPIDALTLALCDYPALATCGAKNLPAWLPAAARTKQVLLAQDPDAAGDAGAEECRQAFTRCGVATFRLRPGAGDWNDALRRYGRENLRFALVVQIELS